MSPATVQHFDQARENRDCAHELLRRFGIRRVYVQWAVTAAFYCAVHCMQGYLVSRGLDPQTHARREVEIADPMNGVPTDVYRAYMSLKQISVRARYRCATFDPVWVQRSVLDGRLKTITDFVNL